jgi:ribosome-associated protein
MSAERAADYSQTLAQRFAEIADSKAATEIIVLDMRGLVSYTDFLTICTARNERQARAIADEVKLRLKEERQLLPAGAEAAEAAGWIVLDYLDCVLHVFTEEERQRYQLEDLWREAVEVGRRAQELSEAQAASSPEPAAPNGNGHAAPIARDVFEGLVKVEIGPLDDFSQLVGFEDAAGQIGATSEISVERFSEGRATLSMRLSEPTDLLHELEQRSPLDFHVRRTADDNVVLDIDDEAGPEQRAA